MLQGNAPEDSAYRVQRRNVVLRAHYCEMEYLNEIFEDNIGAFKHFLTGNRNLFGRLLQYEKLSHELDGILSHYTGEPIVLRGSVIGYKESGNFNFAVLNFQYSRRNIIEVLGISVDVFNKYLCEQVQAVPVSDEAFTLLQKEVEELGQRYRKLQFPSIHKSELRFIYWNPIISEAFLSASAERVCRPTLRR